MSSVPVARSLRIARVSAMPRWAKHSEWNKDPGVSGPHFNHQLATGRNIASLSDSQHSWVSECNRMCEAAVIYTPYFNQSKNLNFAADYENKLSETPNQ